MRSRIILIILLVALVVFLGAQDAFARSSSDDLLRQGLLGAGSGAIGGAASGAKGGDVWKGALAGAGVNIVGNALLDSMSGEKVDNVQQVDRYNSRNAYQEGYQSGYANGYKSGYTAGYKDGLREAYQEQR